MKTDNWLPGAHGSGDCWKWAGENYQGSGNILTLDCSDGYIHP